MTGLDIDGVLPALVTPMTADGDVDEPTLRMLVERSVSSGVGGLVACGSTGEFSTLTGAERRRVLEVVCVAAAGRVPVIAQTGAVSTATAVSLSRHAAEHGASALLCVPPYYERLGRDELAMYYATIVEATPLPVVFYNFPSLSKVVLSAAQIAELASSVGIRAVKDSGGDSDTLAGLLAREPGLTVYNGWDPLTLYAFELGGRRSICGAATFMPDLWVALLDAVEHGSMDDARALWRRISLVLDVLSSGSYLAGVKAACGLLGLSVGVPRRPVAPLDPATAERLKASLADADIPALA